MAGTPNTLDALLNGPAVITITDAGAYLGVSRSVAYRLAESGVIPTIQASEKRYLVPAAKLAVLLGANDLAEIRAKDPLLARRTPTPEEIDQGWEFYREDEDAKEEAAST